MFVRSRLLIRCSHSILPELQTWQVFLAASGATLMLFLAGTLRPVSFLHGLANLGGLLFFTFLQLLALRLDEDFID